MNDKADCRTKTNTETIMAVQVKMKTIYHICLCLRPTYFLLEQVHLIHSTDNHGDFFLISKILIISQIVCIFLLIKVHKKSAMSGLLTGLTKIILKNLTAYFTG